jgi:glycosyltransferase involved in cell wall biosynthesis
MRLALLTHEPFHPPSGGGSAEANYLVRELVRRGHEVHVFCPAIANPNGVAAAFNIRLHLFNRWRMGRYTRWRNFKYLAYPFGLERLVVKTVMGSGIRFDVFLTQHAIAAVAGGRLKRRLGVALVMNQLDFLTGFMETWPRWRMPRTLLRSLERYELSLPRRYDADAVLTVSDTLADRLAGNGCPRERLTPIYYGYDAARFAFDPAALAARQDQPPVVVMHGSFDHHHLGAVALGALARVRRERPETVFRFVGQTTEALRSFLASARAQGLGEGIECVGFMPYEQVAGSLARASVGIIPYEDSAGVQCAFVAKAVEYLGLGLPAVSTALEGIRRQLGTEPLLRFTPFDGAAFGDAILAWLRTPLAERGAEAAPTSRRMAARLDWGRVCAVAAAAVEIVVARQGGVASDLRVRAGEGQELVHD